MPKGSGKLKVAGIIETVTSSIVVLVFLYGIIVFAGKTDSISSYANAGRQFDRNTILGAAAVFIFYHIYRLIVSIIAFRKADNIRSAGVIFSNGMAILVMSCFWMIIVLAALSAAGETVSGVSGVKTVLGFLLADALADTVFYIIIVVGASQNKPRPPVFNPWMQNPYNMPPMGNPYGAPNPYGNPAQPPFAAPDRNMYGAPPQPPFGVPQPPFGAPPQPPFGTQNLNAQFGGFRPPYPPQNFGGQPPFADPDRVAQFAQQNPGPVLQPQSVQHMPKQPEQPQENTVSSAEENNSADTML